MQRFTLHLLLFSALLFAISCNTPPTSQSGDTDGVYPGGEPTQTGGGGGINDNPGTSGGQNYTVTTIDTTIKSPRRELKGTVNGVDVTINYGSPAVNQRTIYGDLVPYGKVWRTGANEATRITFGQDVKVGEEGTMLSAGTYSLFTLPADRDNWTIIFNKTADQWGAYDYDEGADAARVRGTATTVSSAAERMDFAVDGNNIELMWDDLMVSFPVMAAAK